MLRLVFQGACRDGHSDACRAMQLEDARAFVGGGAAGHHVVEQQEVSAAEIAAAFEGATHVPVTFLERQFGLRRRGARALQAVAVDRYFQAFSR